MTVLAFVALLATAGVAYAAGHDDRGVGGLDVRAELDRAGHGRGGQATDHGGGAQGSGHDSGHPTNDEGGATADGVGNGGTTGGVDGSGANQGGGDVTATGVDAPPTPVDAPAAATSGPAPDVAAAAPSAGPVVNRFLVDAVTSIAPGGDGSTPTDPSATEPALSSAVPEVSSLTGLAGVPDLRSVGAVTKSGTDQPTAAGRLLSTGPGRSLALVAVLLLAIGVFLSVHRWADRGDRKLAAARSGSDVARFR